MSARNTSFSPFLSAGMFISMSIPSAPRWSTVLAWYSFRAGVSLPWGKPTTVPRSTPVPIRNGGHVLVLLAVYTRGNVDEPVYLLHAEVEHGQGLVLLHGGSFVAVGQTTLSPQMLTRAFQEWSGEPDVMRLHRKGGGAQPGGG